MKTPIYVSSTNGSRTHWQYRSLEIGPGIRNTLFKLFDGVGGGEYIEYLIDLIFDRGSAVRDRLDRDPFEDDPEYIKTDQGPAGTFAVQEIIQLPGS